MKRSFNTSSSPLYDNDKDRIDDGYYDYYTDHNHQRTKKYHKITEVQEINNNHDNYQQHRNIDTNSQSSRKLTFKDFKHDIETNNGNKEIQDKDISVIKDISTELSKTNSGAIFDPKSIIYTESIISIPITFKKQITYKILKSIRVQCGTLFKSMLIDFNTNAHEWKVELRIFRDSTTPMNKRLEDKFDKNIIKINGRKISQIENFNDIITKLTEHTNHKRDILCQTFKDIIECIQNRWSVQSPISIHVAIDTELNDCFLLIKGVSKINYNLIQYIAELCPSIVSDTIELTEADDICVLYVKIH